MGRNLSGIRTLINGGSALATVGVLNSADLAGAEQVSLYVHFGPGTTVGSVVIEGAHDPSFTGTWAVIATIDWASANEQHNVSISGNHAALRARISTAVVGGTVSVYALVSG